MSSTLGITASDYHADLVADKPTLSKSIAHTLITKSAAHARAEHPRLNPHFVRKEDEKFDIGTAAHSLLLEGDDGVYVVQADDWRTKASKEEREYARSMGRVALLGKHWDAVQQMVAATRSQLERVSVSPPLFADGTAERTLVWDEGGVTCRARLDWLRDDLTAIDDYKTTSRSASPDAWSRSMFGIGADLQVAFYLRGLKAVTGKDAAFRFVVQETFEPYALCVFTLGPDAMALANEKATWAIEQWRACLERDEWPAYPTRVCHIQSPPWAEPQWFDREARDAA